MSVPEMVEPGDATRQRLVEAAATVFAERGYDKAGVQEIARRAGLTTGAIYGRFTGKAELLRSAISWRTHDELDELFNQHGFDGHAADLLRTVGSHLVTRRAVATDDNALLLEAFVAARRDPEVADFVRGLMQERTALMVEVIDAAKADGTIDPELDTQSLVRFCHAVGLGFVLYEAIGLDLPGAEPWQAVIDRLVDAVAPVNPPTP